MTQLLRGYLSGNRGSAKFGLLGNEWRRVPKIDLLPPKGRGPIGTLLVVAMVLLLAVEAVLLWNLLSALSDAQAPKDQRARALLTVERQLATAETEVQRLNAEKDQLQRGRGNVDEAQEELASAHMDWGTVLTAIFEAEIPGILFDSVITAPGAGGVGVVGTAENIEAIVSFQARIGDRADILDLQNLQWKEVDASLSFSAEFTVRRPPGGE